MRSIDRRGNQRRHERCMGLIHCFLHAIDSLLPTSGVPAVCWPSVVLRCLRREIDSGQGRSQLVQWLWCAGKKMRSRDGADGVGNNYCRLIMQQQQQQQRSSVHPRRAALRTRRARARAGLCLVYIIYIHIYKEHKNAFLFTRAQGVANVSVHKRWEESRSETDLSKSFDVYVDANFCCAGILYNLIVCCRLDKSRLLR